MYEYQYLIVLRKQIAKSRPVQVTSENRMTKHTLTMRRGSSELSIVADILNEIFYTLLLYTYVNRILYS